MKIISRKEAIALGLPRYFTGKPCVNGHISERVTKKCDCVACNNERNAEYRSKPENQEAGKARSKAWRVAMGREAYYQYILACRERGYGSNAEYWKDYNDRTRDYHSLRTKIWVEENPDKKRNIDRLRKSRIKGAEGTHNADDISTILDRQSYICVYCNSDLLNGYHVDHIMPIALGGSNWPDNLQCLCPTCNMRKGAKHPDEWHREIGHTA